MTVIHWFFMGVPFFIVGIIFMLMEKGYQENLLELQDDLLSVNPSIRLIKTERVGFNHTRLLFWTVLLYDPSNRFHEVLYLGNVHERYQSGNKLQIKKIHMCPDTSASLDRICTQDLAQYNLSLISNQSDIYSILEDTIQYHLVQKSISREYPINRIELDALISIFSAFNQNIKKMVWRMYADHYKKDTLIAGFDFAIPAFSTLPEREFYPIPVYIVVDI